MSKPILFTKENRTSTRNGTKTQTRRVIVDDLPVRARLDGHDDLAWQETTDERGNDVPKVFGNEMWWEEVDLMGNATENYFIWNAPYRIGEIRYVCEPYRVGSADRWRISGNYLDDNQPFSVDLTLDEWNRFAGRKQPNALTQARFMYKSLARTLVEITDLRRESLQEISEEDAIAEGLAQWTHKPSGTIHYGITYADIWEKDPRQTFQRLWDSINARRGYGWSTNPTVLVVEYKVVKP